MNVLLDTHVWIWINSSPEKISSNASKILFNKKNDNIFISIISCWEVSKLHENRKIGFNKPLYEWINRALEYPDLCVLELTPKACAKPSEFSRPEISDPIDQMIIATALENDLPLITADENLRKYSPIITIW